MLPLLPYTYGSDSGHLYNAPEPWLPDYIKRGFEAIGDFEGHPIFKLFWGPAWTRLTPSVSNPSSCYMRETLNDSAIRASSVKGGELLCFGYPYFYIAQLIRPAHLRDWNFHQLGPKPDAYYAELMRVDDRGRYREPNEADIITCLELYYAFQADCYAELAGFELLRRQVSVLEQRKALRDSLDDEVAVKQKTLMPIRWATKTNLVGARANRGVLLGTKGTRHVKSLIKDMRKAFQKERSCL